MTPLSAAELQSLLQEALEVTVVEVTDLSEQHRHHRGAKQSGGGHYAVLLVSPLFVGKTTMQQHRLVYQALQTEMGQRIHALSLQTYASPDYASRSRTGN
jgi:BolA protein